MGQDVNISLRNAAIAFGPCAGGTHNAMRQIIDKLEEDELFWRKIVGDRSLWRSRFINSEVSPTAEWFRLYSSLGSQHPAGFDPEFDDFRDEVERILYETDDLVVDYDEVRSIWFPLEFAEFIPNAELATTWSFTQALAWAATKDLGIVGAIDYLDGIERTGWLAVLLSERCEKCSKLANTPRWQQCHCLTNAFSSLCTTALPQLGADDLPPTLKPSVVDGCFKANTNSIHLQFDPADIRSIFPVAISATVTPSKKKGAKVITDEAKQLWLERRANGHGQRSANREAEFIHKLLTERHRNTGREVPSAGTVRKRIADWLVELGEVK